MRAVILSALLLSACATSGTNYDETALQRLHVGMTKAEVVQMLGKPNLVVTNADGSQRLTWSHASVSMLGSTKSRAVALPFDAQGKLTSVPAPGS